MYNITYYVIIQLEAWLRPNIGFTLWGNLALFTRSAITQSKVNQFGWNLEHSENIVWGWPRQILGVISLVATAWEPGETLFDL